MRITSYPGPDEVTVSLVADTLECPACRAGSRIPGMLTGPEDLSPGCRLMLKSFECSTGHIEAIANASRPLQASCDCMAEAINRDGPHHHSVVCFGADDAAHALRRLPHSIKGQVVALLDLEGLPEILQPGPALPPC